MPSRKQEQQPESGESTRLLALTADVGRALTTGDSLAEMLGGCAQALVTRLGAAFARVWVLDDTGGVLELRASAGLYTHLDGPHGRVPVGQFKIGLIAQQCRPHLTNAVVGDPRVSDQEWARREGMVAFAGYPLIVAGRLVGVVAMFARHPLSNVTLQAIGSVADEIAIGISRRRTEEALRQGEAHLRLVTDSLPVMIASVDAEERYRFNNRTYEQWTGLSRAQITGRTLRDVLGEASYEKAAPDIARVLSGQTVTHEREQVWPDGRTRFVHGTYVPQFGPAGQVEGFTILVTDMTEARQAAAGLAATNQRLQSALAREALVNRISRAARGSSDPDLILRSTIAALGPAVGADRCYYVTYGLPRDHGTLGPDWHREGLSSVAGEYRLSDYTPDRNPASLAGQTDVVEDAFAQPDNALAVTLGLRSLIRVPLPQGDTVTALVVAMAHESRRWTADEVALVETVAAQTRAAVEATRAGQRERLLLTDVLASVTEGKLRLVAGPEQLPPPLTPVGDPISLTREGGLRELRQRAEEATRLTGHAAERRFDLVTAASEAGMNAVTHGGGAGTAWVSVGESGTVQVRVEDHGVGIQMANLPRATLARGFSTQATLGHGLKLMLETIDRLYLLTGPGGTTVVIEQSCDPPLPLWLQDAG